MWQKCHIFFYVAYIPKHNVLNLLLRSAADEINEYVMPVHTSAMTLYASSPRGCNIFLGRRCVHFIGFFCIM